MFLRIALVALAALVFWAVLVRASDATAHERVYVVRPADTLWTIATRHYAGDPREAVWKLRQRNGLETAHLTPGQRLVLPPS